MRVLVLSDLHREFAANYEHRISTPEPTLGVFGADLVILAGDTDTGVMGVRWARQFFGATPVLYVPGNHEYYANKIGSLQPKLREEAAGSSIAILDDEAVELGGYRFFGTTLWTDFEIYGNRTEAMREAGQHPGGMSDFRRIRRASDFRRFQPADAVRMHAQSRARLLEFLKGGPRDRSIVISHHAPSPKSLLIRRNDKRDAMDPAYASNLEALIEQEGPAIWVHGHIHSARDYRVGTTRVVCNPRGYPDEAETGFRPDLVIELG